MVFLLLLRPCLPGDSPDYSKVQDVCAISSAIKEYFRSIPEPLVPVAQQERLLRYVWPFPSVCKFGALLESSVV